MSTGKASVVHLRKSVDGGSAEEVRSSKSKSRSSQTLSQPSGGGKEAGAAGGRPPAQSPFEAFKDDVMTIGVRLLVFGAVWIAGMAGLSFAWLFILVALLMTWEKRKRTTLRKAKIGQHLEDMGLVLAHTRELPSWVSALQRTNACFATASALNSWAGYLRDGHVFCLVRGQKPPHAQCYSKVLHLERKF